MRGKRYSEDKRRVLPSGGYVGIIVAVLVIAALVAITLLVILPTTEESSPVAPSIVSISYEQNAIGAGTSPENVYFTVTYSDGSTEDVALSNMICEGLDVNGVTGTVQQNISVSYGGFSDTLTVNVKKIDCVLEYKSSDGGKIQGTAKQTVISGADAETVIAVPETGYTFKGWSDGYPLAERKDRGVNETKSFIAIFEKTQYEVVFFFRDGSTVRAQKVLYGGAANDIPDENDPRMKVYGYTFTGWSVAEEDYKNVTRDMNIYPRYEKTATDVSVTVSSDKDGNEMGETDAKECGYYQHGESAAIVATPYNARFFKQWSVLNSQGEYVSLGRNDTETIEVKIGDKETPITFRVSAAAGGQGTYYVSFTPNADVEFIDIRAEFAYEKSPVTFVNYQNKNVDNIEATVSDVDNGKGQTLGERIEELGGVKKESEDAYMELDTDESSRNYGLPIPAQVYGMTFVGWYLQKDPTQTVISREQIFIEPTVIIAKWEKKLYQLVFQYEDNYNITNTYGDPVYVYYQNTVGSGGGIPEGVPHRDMYTFKGWVDKYTGNVIDDSTQIIVQSKYIEEGGEDFQKGIIRIVAAWEAVSHELNVRIVGGEGSVRLTSMFEGRSEVSDIFGTAIITENRKYTVGFNANAGHKIQDVVWQYGASRQVFSGNDVQIAGFGINIEKEALKTDNYIEVRFVPCEYTVTVLNGDSRMSGYVTTENGAVYDKDRITLNVNAFAPIYFNIASQNASYAIDAIYVTGKADDKDYHSYAKYISGSEEGVTEYDISLKNVSSDITVDIRYKGKQYNVTVNQAAYSNGTYPIMLTSFNGRESDYRVPDGSTEYIYDEKVFYVIRAEEGKYISGVSFDGIAHDLYERTSTVYFYDREVNGVSLGITLMNIGGEYYYCYGKAGAEQYGVDYLYCEKTETGRTVVFEVIDEGSADYRAYDIATAEGALLCSYLESALRIGERRLSDTSVVKDNRITSVKLMLIVRKNINITVKTSDLSYSFKVNGNDFAEVEYDSSAVPVGGSVTVSVSPITGYTVTGYEVNGVKTAVTGSDAGKKYVFTVNGITEDIEISVICEPVTYNLVFVNASANKGELYVVRGTGERNLMDSTYAYRIEYGDGGRFTVIAGEGKRISKVKINGEQQTVVYNATSYVYANYRVSESVKVEIECDELIANESGSYNVVFNASENVFTSVEYGEANKVYVMAERGYKLSRITVSGLKGNSSVLKEINFSAAMPGYVSYNEDVGLATITIGASEFDSTVTVTCAETPEAYPMTLSVVGGGEKGSIFGSSTVYYGNTDTISVSANSNYYIHSFKINGESVSMVSGGWVDKTRAFNGKYTAGEYRFVATGPVYAEVEFKLFTYKVTLDSDSINGTTAFIIEGEGTDSDIGRIAHGKSLTVSMSADSGYHISKIYINGREADYVPYTTVENNNTSHFFVVNNVTNDIKIYVKYDINRYQFRYSLVNGSANFGEESDTGNGLDCRDAVLIEKGVYGNIAHGDNFSFNVTPGRDKGYYVYSIRIVYSNYFGEGNQRLRYAGDGFTADGGTIWFNRFLWENSASGSVGVTADIQLIEVVFKKKTYSVTAELDGGEPDGGKLDFYVLNTVNPDGGVYMFDSEGDDAGEYMYLDGTIYRKSDSGNGEYERTDIKMTLRGSKWTLYSKRRNEEYVMYFEYGLKYYLIAEPEKGYERSVLNVITYDPVTGEEKEEDKLGSVYNDKYIFNINKRTHIKVAFSILTFDIEVTSIAYRANSKEVAANSVYTFADVKIVRVEKKIIVNGLGEEEEQIEEVELARLGEGSATLRVTVDYGMLIRIIITPKFNEQGAYLFSLQTKTSESKDKLDLTAWDSVRIGSDGTGTTVYGGTEEITAHHLFRATFRVKEYQIRVLTAYTESDIRGETINLVASDTMGVSLWNVAWSSSAVIKIVAGAGYYVDKIVIKYKDGTDREKTIEDYQKIPLTGPDGSYTNGNVTIRKNDDSPIHDLRDLMTLSNITNAYEITVYFARREYKIIYAVNDVSFIQNIKTSLNRYSIYPKYNYDTREDGIWEINAHHYDEVYAVLTPNDGYEITATSVKVECLDASGNILKDDNQKEMVYFVSLLSTGSVVAVDEKYFTFHRENMSAADYRIQSDVRITVNFAIKEYLVNTSINRVSAIGDDSEGKNDTAVDFTINDRNNNSLQTTVKFEKNDVPAIMTAQHHGFLIYEFTTAEGYYLSDFRINGFTLAELEDEGIIDNSTVGDEFFTMEKSGSGYKYTIKVKVNTKLIVGSSKPWTSITGVKINVSMVISPITYVVRVVLNGNVMPFGAVNGHLGVTDGREITVITSSGDKATHFGTWSIEPTLFEGYKLTDLVTDVFYGNADGCDKAEADRINFFTRYSDKDEAEKVSELIDGYRNLQISNANMKNANLAEGKNWIYIYFNTDIIVYSQNVSTRVYGENGIGADGTVTPMELKNYVNSDNENLAGSVKITVISRDGTESTCDLKTVSEFDGDFEYFTTIIIEAEAQPGFVVYGIYELVNGTERKISGGSRAITYSVVNGKHTVMYTVRDLPGQMIGNRRFVVDFKQQATVTLTVANPYKYNALTKRYQNNITVTAYTSEKEYEDFTTVANTNVTVGDAVVEKYAYTVYLGNYIRFEVRGNNGLSGVAFYDRDLSLTASEEAFGDGGIAGLGNARGEKINRASIDYYAYAGVNAVITTTKTTVGARTDIEGGSVIYNSGSPALGTVNVFEGTGTRPGKTLTVTVRPKENYAFYSLKIRQPDWDASRKKGYVVFVAENVLQWNSLYFNVVDNAKVMGTTVADSEETSYTGSNRSVLKSATKADNGDYVFVFWVCGDLELEVEFHRTYAVSYGIYMTDKYTQGGAQAGITTNGIRFTENSVEDPIYGDAAVSLTSTTSRVSYGASFEINVDKVPDGGYQFVGWYVNGYNVYKYLETMLPPDDNLTEMIKIDITEMPSLLVDNAEVSEITVYAVFQPIIDVLVYNEKYYAFEEHFNSWNLATVLATYYDFVRGQPISGGDTTSSVPGMRDGGGKTINDAMEYLDGALASRYTTEWAELLKGADATAYYNADQKNAVNGYENYKVYSYYAEFSVLYQNITSGDFFTNSWENSTITLTVTNLPSSAQFAGWQYYNWSTDRWEYIQYKYEDPSYGATTGGGKTMVDCFLSTYSLNLSALFATQYNSSHEDIGVIMPYAISATNPKNTVRSNLVDSNDELIDVKGIRPLLLRPDVYQKMSVTLVQNLYVSDLGREDPEQTLMYESKVHPEIASDAYIQAVNMDRCDTASSRRSGTYEYGTRITISNYDGKTELLDGTSVRYRFLGWFIKYNKKLYYMENSEFDATGETNYDVRLTCLSNKAETNITLIALYVAQYKQAIYSYNISGGSDDSFDKASKSKNSYEAAPTLKFTADTTQVIYFDSFSKNDADMITYSKETVEKRYWINSVEDRSKISNDNQKTEFLSKRFEYFIDAGLTYSITFPDVCEAGSSGYSDYLNYLSQYATTISDVQSYKKGGYCPEVDTPYMFVKNDDERNPLLDFSSYYNTGNGTYFIPGVGVVGAMDLHIRANEHIDMYNSEHKSGRIDTDKDDAKRVNTYNFRYVSTATLLFYNITYKSGITIPASLASVITGGRETGEFTVWDEDEIYGDYLEIANNKPVENAANGEVVIRVTLINSKKGFQDFYYLAYAGMKSGYGFPTRSHITGPSGGSLFVPSTDGETETKELLFERWREVDMASLTDNTCLFGSVISDYVSSYKVGLHAATPAKYNTTNCGDAVTGYRITSVKQLRAIETFWQYNNQSCVGIINPDLFEYFTAEGRISPMWANDNEMTENYTNYYGRTRFILTEASYNLTGVSRTGPLDETTMLRGASPWVPMFAEAKRINGSEYVYGMNKMPVRDGGFDGELDGALGNGKVARLYGLASWGLDCEIFGLFECISGGCVRNLIIDNTYISAEDARYIGSLAGKIEYSTVENITFEKHDNYLIFASSTFTSMSDNHATQNYIDAPSAYSAGLLAGYAQESTIRGVNLNFVNSRAYINILIGRDDVGLVIGTVTDNSTVNNVYVGGNGWALLDAINGDGGYYVGGIIGVLSGGSTVDSVNFTLKNIVLGNLSNTTSAGGLIGEIRDVTTTLRNVRFITAIGDSAINFKYSQDDQVYYGSGVYLFTRMDAGGFGSEIATTDSVGKAGGLVGYNEGQILNDSDTTNKNVVAVVKAAGSYLGGLVGVNAGRVSGFDLAAGYNNSSLLLMAWIKGNVTSYGIGGVTGANLGSEIEKTVTRVTTAEASDMFKISQIHKGIVDDCSFTGTVNPSSSSRTNWKEGHVYVFIKTEDSDEGYSTIQTGAIESSLNTIARFALMLGGIAGYNSGSILNCFVKNSKITYNVQHNATDNETTVEPIGRGYSWGFYGGLIVGYNDFKDKAEAGWYEMMMNGIYPYNDLFDILVKDMLTYRVQSCFTQDSVIAVVGRVFMDEPGGWAKEGKFLESYKCGISMAGISGGSSENAASRYGITACKATGNKFIYYVPAYGYSIGANKGSNLGWDYSDTGTGTFDPDNDYFYHYCKHPFHIVELTVANISTGLRNDKDFNGMTYIMENLNSGTVQYTKSYDKSATETTEAFVDPGDDSTIGAVKLVNHSHWEGLKFVNPKKAPAGPNTRYTHYSTLNEENVGAKGKQEINSHIIGMGADMEALEAGTTYSSLADKTGDMIAEGVSICDNARISSTYIDYKVVKTDMLTGMPVYCMYGDKTLRMGPPLYDESFIRSFSVVDDSGNRYYWALYNAPLDRDAGFMDEYPSAGAEKNPSTYTFCVRGQ